MSVTIKIILKRKFTLSPHKFDSLRSTLPKDYREKNKTIRKRLYAQAAENEYRERNKWGLEGPTENSSSQLESKHVHIHHPAQRPRSEQMSMEMTSTTQRQKLGWVGERWC